jgi:hypothetical protein
VRKEVLYRVLLAKSIPNNQTKQVMKGQMKTAPPIILGLLILVGCAIAQTPTHQKAKTETAQKRTVSLNTILSCPEDSIVRSVFKTNLATMRKLHVSAMIINHTYEKDDEDSIAVRYAGFISSGSDPLNFGIMAADSHGDYWTRPNRTFCSGAFVARYQDIADSLPYAIAILPAENEWAFNINELFSHADHFKFTSGVFTDSSDVFFTATKGLVDLQFIPKPDGLTLYRVIIKNDKP